tara:strand:+ start:17260 stop:17679 length:420 start_codon:yes stop_codon:yes gene_type:complete
LNIEICSEKYTSSLLVLNPNKIFVFGDNIKRYGKGGQAVIRHQPNAYGIATKRYPSKDDWAYFSDKEDEFTCVLDDLRGLYFLSKTHTIVFPCGGIGTGLADMENRSPRLFIEMNRILKEHFGYVNGGNHIEENRATPR